MEINVGDKIIYEDGDLNFFTGKIVDIWKNDENQISGYFVVTDTELYIHFKPSSLGCVRLGETIPVS